jgi:hypothetical protein
LFITKNKTIFKSFENFKFQRSRSLDGFAKEFCFFYKIRSLFFAGFRTSAQYLFYLSGKFPNFFHKKENNLRKPPRQKTITGKSRP